MNNARISLINIDSLFSLIFTNRVVEFLIGLFKSLVITNALESPAKSISLLLDHVVALLISLTYIKNRSGAENRPLGNYCIYIIWIIFRFICYSILFSVRYK